jgi:hypothetical protein
MYRWIDPLARLLGRARWVLTSPIDRPELGIYKR